jgi:hypothetical protein
MFVILRCAIAHLGRAFARTRNLLCAEQLSFRPDCINVIACAPVSAVGSARIHLRTAKLSLLTHFVKGRILDGTSLCFETCDRNGGGRYGARRRCECRAAGASVVGATRGSADAGRRARGDLASRCRSSQAHAGSLGPSLAPPSLGLASPPLASSSLALSAGALPLKTKPRASGALSYVMRLRSDRAAAAIAPGEAGAADATARHDHDRTFNQRPVRP